MASNTLTYSELIEYQIDLYNIYVSYTHHIIFIITTTAETNRAPFDLTEAEAELVAGYNTEYQGIYFSLIFLAEYSNIMAISSLYVLYFLGGSLFSYSGILLESHLIILFILIRSTFPR